MERLDLRRRLPSDRGRERRADAGARELQGGKMLFLGLGTGLGSAMIVDGALVPMELGHLPYRKDKVFEDFVGAAGLKRLGKKKWGGTCPRRREALGCCARARVRGPRRRQR